MLYRQVLMRFGEQVTAEQRAQVVACQRRFAEIPEVHWVRAGLALTPTGRLPFSLGLLVCLGDEDGRDRYVAHPLHRSAQQLIHPLMDDFVVIDGLG